MKGFRNIGTLDLRKATPDALKEITFIENIGNVLLSEDQMTQISHIKQEDIGSLYGLPQDVKVVAHNGEYILSHDMLNKVHEKLFLMINGVLRVEDLKEISLENKLYKMVVNGQVIAKEKDFGLLSGILELNGEGMTYRNNETYIEGGFSLEDDELYGIKPDTYLLVDTLKVIKDFDLELFYKNIKNLRVRHHIVIKKDLIPHIAQKIENYSNVKKTIVKEGYSYYDHLTLHPDNIQAFKGKNIHVGGTLKIQVSPELLGEKIEKIICKKIEIKKGDLESIRPLLESADKIKVIDPNVKSNYSKFILDKDVLENLKPLKLENYGKTLISKDLTKDLILEGVEWIENYGVIACFEEQYALILEKVKSNYGSIKIKSEKAQDVDGIISNMGSYEY